MLSMHCPFCDAEDTRVVDSRPADGGSAIRRRRECAECGNRFTTYERREAALVVRKRNGTVHDLLTGLIWLKDASCDDLGPNGDGTATWQEALDAANGLAAGHCDLTDKSERL